MICCELSVCKCVKIDKRSFSFKHTFLRSLSVLHRPVHLAAVGAFSSSVHLLIVCTFFYKKNKCLYCCCCCYYYCWFQWRPVCQCMLWCRNVGRLCCVFRSDWMHAGLQSGSWSNVLASAVSSSTTLLYAGCWDTAFTITCVTLMYTGCPIFLVRHWIFSPIQGLVVLKNQHGSWKTLKNNPKVIEFATQFSHICFPLVVAAKLHVDTQTSISHSILR